MKNKSPKGPRIVVVVAVLLLVATLILGNQSFTATQETAFDEFNQRQLVLAREATGGIELYFENLASDMRALARVPEVQYLDEDFTRRELQFRFDELQPWGVNDIGVLDARGVLRYNVAAHQIEGTDFSWRRYYQEAQVLTSGDIYIIEFIEFKGAEAGEKGLLLAVPMFETAASADHPTPSGRFTGVVVCTLKLDTIVQKFVAPIQASEGGHAFLIDGEYNVLWSPDKSLFGKNLVKESKGFSALQGIVREMSAGNSGVGEYDFYSFDDTLGAYDRDKREGKLIAYAPIQLGAELWGIGVWAPKADARQLIQSVYHRQLVLVGAGILSILGGSIYALAMSFRTTKFLEKKVEAKAGEVIVSHERLLTVLDSLDASVYVADMETYEILFANQHLQSIWGDVVGKTCWQVLQAGQSGPCDFCSNDELLTADGEPAGVCSWEVQNTVNGHWYEVRDRAIRWMDGRVVRLEVAIDITERKSMEEALRESEERCRQLVELSPDAIAVQSKDRIVFVNPAGAGLFGAENPKQLVGKSVWDFVLPENRALVEKRYRLLRAKGAKVPPIEQRFIRLDGTYIDVDVRATRFTYKGEPAILAIFHDITERKRTEEALKAAHAYQQSIIDGVAEPIMVIGADYRVKLMNRAAREFAFRGDGASEHRFCYQISHMGEVPCKGMRHPCPMERVRETGRPVTVVHEHHRANGERRFVEVIAAPLWGADGTFEGIIESTRDITEHKWAEEALEQQVRALARSNEDLEQFAYKVVRSIQDFFEKLPSD